jgi:hypothetical protein
VNAKFMRWASMGGGRQVAGETARLIDELGLNASLADLPEADEIVARLVRIRPDWGWKEDLDPMACRGGTPLSKIAEQGIYNRAIVLSGERTPYTQGLENEFKALAGVPEDVLRDTALGRWLEGVVACGCRESRCTRTRWGASPSVSMHSGRERLPPLA